ncbi:MAG TPA: MFS transporter [Nocardioidaceae bacterium]|nr:MFS transporter [Nocardioidaceae bacterium]
MSMSSDVSTTVPVAVDTSRPAPGVSAAPLADLTGIGLFTLITGAFLPIMSFFVINVALPAIGSDLDASPAALQLVVGSYGIANAALVVVGGRLGDAFGRRRLFLTGIASFTAFSLLCGLAHDVQTLLAFRVGQGASAALMTPQVLATISATLVGESRMRAIGMFGAAGGVAAAAGQIVGGALVSANVFGLDWRAVFLINVPIGAAAFLAAHRAIPETRADVRLPIDVWGAGMLATTLLLLLLPLTEGRPLGWPVWTWIVLASAVPVLAVLSVHQRRTERSGRVPLVPPSVLALPAMRIGMLIGIAFFTTFGGFMFTFALATQGEAQMSPLRGGLTLLPMAIAFMIVSFVLPAVQRRWGASVIARGWALQAVGYGLMAVMVLRGWPDISPLSLAAPMALAGAGGGLVMMPLFGVVLSQVPPQQAGLGSGILITMQQTCLALGAATIGTLFLTWSSRAGSQGDGLAGVCGLIVAVALVSIPISLQLTRIRSHTD